MNRLMNKLIIFTLCMAVYIQYGEGRYAVVSVITAVTISALCEYLRKDELKAACFIAFCAFGVLYFPLLYFLPLASCDLWALKPRWMAAVIVLPLAVHFARPSPVTYALLAVYILLACLMNHQTQLLQRQKSENIALRDSTKELSTGLFEKNKELLEKQDYEINLATLRERNRIAREMHDTVGHLLSSSILQTGALLATCTEQAQMEGLARLHKTLSQGMDSVRGAIHDLHDESVDLFAELQTLTQGFAFCPVSFDYDVLESPDPQIRYAFIAVVKEGLSNVAKHSNAARAEVVVREHPALYQLVVRDNGTTSGRSQPDAGQGMGLKNIRDRVESLGGIVNISTGHGFELFVSVKKRKQEQTQKEASQ
ncbi:MAG: sensor histidine kinase [Acetanaerobacterium sp.]